MKKLEEFKFNFKECQDELIKFKNLLDSKQVLQESQDILPFFKENKNLIAFLGTFVGNTLKVDRIASEFCFFGDFRADYVIGNSNTMEFLLIEFEDASENSIFKRNGKKATLEWATRFEHGYSQIMDWLWKIDDLKRTETLDIKFGGRIQNHHGMLIIGRDEFVEDDCKSRLKWRVENTRIASKSIICLTYDELYRTLDEKIKYLYAIFNEEEETVNGQTT